MFPALSELYWLLLQPSSVVFVLLVISLLLLVLGVFRGGRLLLLVALSLAALPAVLPVRDALAVPLEQHVPKPATLPGDVDGIIVLGGSVDWQVTLARRQLALNETGERMMAAAALAQRYPDAALVLTGIFGDTLEGEFRATRGPHTFFAGPEYLDRRPVFIGDARSTYEDALLALETVQPQGEQRWLLVTSALHMPRALAVFQALGWSVSPYPVDYTTTGRIEVAPTLEVLPALTALDKVVREWGALVVYNATGRTRTLLPELR